MFHRSERLLLRPGWIEDAAELTATIADEAIIRNLARVPWPYREEHAVFWLEAPKIPMLPGFLLTLPDAHGSHIIGSCGLHEGHEGSAEIGYWIAREFWGQGFATEAARAVLAIARAIGHKRVIGRHAEDNPASGQVLRKAGFVPMGTVGRYYSIGRGAEVSAPIYVAELEAHTGDNGNAGPSDMLQAA